MRSIDLDTTEHDEKIAALEARVEELKGLLRGLEWADGIDWRGHRCPVCMGLDPAQWRYSAGHTIDCRLRAALENI